jgi:AcrR family transcriptional regulator
LEAAAAVLVERRGKLEIADVAAKAGLSVGLSYHYFGSRGGLIAAVVEAFYDRYDAEVMDVNPSPGSRWAEREHRRVQMAVDFHYREPLAPIVLSRLGGEPEVAAVEARRLARVVEIGTRNVALGQAEGEIPKSLDPNITVAMMMGGLHAALGQALARDPRPDKARLAREIWGAIAALARIPDNRNR